MEKSHSVVLAVYKATKLFPKEELFGLTNQMRRAAISAESNIAEGFGRNTAKDKCHFFAITKGSLLEIQSQMITACDLGYLDAEVFAQIHTEIVHAIRLTSGLIRSATDK